MERPNFCKRVCLWDVMFVSVDGHVTRQKKKIFVHVSCDAMLHDESLCLFLMWVIRFFHKARLLSPHAVRHQVHLSNLLKKKHLCSWRRKGFFLCILFPPPPLFPMCSLEEHSPSSQVVPQDIPNSTLDLSHMVCPKFNSHVYKLKR